MSSAACPIIVPAVADDAREALDSQRMIDDMPVAVMTVDTETYKITYLNEASKRTLGQRLGVTTVAEGVETEDHLQLVSAEGCTEVQGYLFGRPEPIETIGRERQQRSRPG